VISLSPRDLWVFFFGFVVVRFVFTRRIAVLILREAIYSAPKEALNLGRRVLTRRF